MAIITSTLFRQSVFVVPTVVHIARRRGLFDDVGLDVATDLVPSSVAQRDDLVAGRCDVAITAIDNLFAWNAAGADVALIGEIETSTRLVLALRPGLSDLDGSGQIRLGVDAPNNGFAVVLRAFMAHRGIGPERYTLVEVGGVAHRLEALAAGAVDATLLSPPLDEVAVSRGMALTGPSLAEVAPDYPGLGVVCRRAILAEKRPLVIGYLTALGRALELARASGDVEVATWLSADRYDQQAVAAARETMPASLTPSALGLRVLAQMREQLDMRVPGAPAPEELVERGVVADVESALCR